MLERNTDDLWWDLHAWEDYLHWQEHHPGHAARINDLVAAIRRTPFHGLGKPEPLKGDLAGWWSRRIDLEHRLAYRVVEVDASKRKRGTGALKLRVIHIAQARRHYDR